MYYSDTSITKKHSILGLLPLFKAIEEKGGHPEELLGEFGLSLDTMTGGAVIEQSLELEIVNATMRILDDPLLGVKVGSQVSFTSYGTYAMLLMTAPTFQESSRASIQFQTLSLLFSQMSLNIEKDALTFRYTFPEAPSHLKNFMADRDLCGTYIFLKEFFDNAKQFILGAGTARPRPTGVEYEIYRKYIDFDIQFDQPFNWFRFPLSILRTVPRHGNETAYKLYRVQAQELMRKLYPDSGNIVALIRQVLEGYDSGFPNVVEASKMIGASERTLRRKLSAAGTCYRQLLDEHRKKRAIDMLCRRDIKIHEIAESLGYNESSSFLRAFKRWYSCTPKQYLRTR